VAGAEAGMASRRVARSIGFIPIDSTKGMAPGCGKTRFPEGYGLKSLRENSTGRSQSSNRTQ
jgi:hypothetical protein